MGLGLGLGLTWWASKQPTTLAVQLPAQHWRGHCACRRAVSLAQRAMAWPSWAGQRWALGGLGQQLVTPPSARPHSGASSARCASRQPTWLGLG